MDIKSLLIYSQVRKQRSLLSTEQKSKLKIAWFLFDFIFYRKYKWIEINQVIKSRGFSFVHLLIK